MDLFLPINLLEFCPARESLTEHSQDVDIIVLVDAQPWHISLEEGAQVWEP